MNGGCRKASTFGDGRLRREQALDALKGLLKRKPAQSRNQPARRLGGGSSNLDNLLNSIRRAILEGQHPGGEDLARLTDFNQCCFGDLPSGLAGDPKAVEMGVDALVEP